MKKILIGGYKDQTVNYAQAFSSLGAELEFLPDPGSRPPAFAVSCDRLFDGLVLPGGGDIAPSLFHRENKGSRNIDKALDCLQLSLLEAFVRAGKPVLGICKGMQLINVGFGGTILQDLKPGSQDIHAWTGRDRIHITKAARGTFPFQLYGSRPIVNSAHHQAVETTGSGLLVAQYSQDFVVEALYHEKLPVLGVQWHPERMCFTHARRDAEDGARLLRYFLSLL